MKITWHGHACFSITHDGYTVVIDPYNADYTTGYPKLRLKADKLLISHEHYGHNCREAVTLSGRPESDCPFEISTLEVSHDSVCGIMRGKCMIHILEVDGLKAVHMGDVGTQLHSGEIGRIFGADALMITAGSCTPMHYRDGNRGARRLEHIDAFTDYFEAPEMIHYYQTNSIIIDHDSEPQVAVLKYIG